MESLNQPHQGEEMKTPSYIYQLHKQASMIVYLICKKWFKGQIRWLVIILWFIEKNCILTCIKISMTMQCFFFKCEFHMKEVEDGRPEDENSKWEETRAYITNIAEARWQRGVYKTYVLESKKSCEVLFVPLDQFKIKPQIGGKYTIRLILFDHLFYKALLLGRFISQH